MAELTPITQAELSPAAAAFLGAHGLSDTPLLRFPSDASARRYTRVVGADVLLMEDPSDPAGFAAFCRVSAHLNGMGLSAPRVLHKDDTTQLALVEDLGDATYATCLAQGEDEYRLYQLAVDALLQLHHTPQAVNVDAPPHDMAKLMEGVQTLAEWFAPAVAPDGATEAFKAAFLGLWRDALGPVASCRNTLVLRDFHVDNLMYLPDRDGVARCGLLDFQDAAIGACEYDLMSLLQDARRDVPAATEAKLLEHYCTNAPEFLGGGAAIRSRYALLGVQRHARIMGVFVRLCQRDAKPHYLTFLPRVIGQFQHAAKEAGLTQILSFMDEALPNWAETGARLSAQALMRPKA